MASRRNKAIFLDRDGVINKDPESINKYKYVTRRGEFVFLPGAKKAVRKLTEAGYAVYIISNQAGVGKGYFTMEDLRSVNGYMTGEIRKAGGRITAAYYCPHRKEDDCRCRKPKAGLFRKALKRGAMDLKMTYFIGDNVRDVQAGRAIGCRTILVLSGKTKKRDVAKLDVKPDHVKRDLLDAVEFILAKEKGER